MGTKELAFRMFLFFPPEKFGDDTHNNLNEVILTKSTQYTVSIRNKKNSLTMQLRFYLITRGRYDIQYIHIKMRSTIVKVK